MNRCKVWMWDPAKTGVLTDSGLTLPAVFLGFLLPREPHQIAGSILGISSQPTPQWPATSCHTTGCDVFMTSILKERLVSTLFPGKAQKKEVWGPPLGPRIFATFWVAKQFGTTSFAEKKGGEVSFSSTWTFNLSVFLSNIFQHVERIITSGDKEKKTVGMSFLETSPHTPDTHQPCWVLGNIGILQPPNRWRDSDLSSATCADWFNVSVVISRGWYTFWKSCPHTICPPLEKQMQLIGLATLRGDMLVTPEGKDLKLRFKV